MEIPERIARELETELIGLEAFVADLGIARLGFDAADASDDANTEVGNHHDLCFELENRRNQMQGREGERHSLRGSLGLLRLFVAEWFLVFWRQLRIADRSGRLNRGSLAARLRYGSSAPEHETNAYPNPSHPQPHGAKNSSLERLRQILSCTRLQRPSR